MRLGDGSDLLGVNDPRSTSIGIIRVDPTDVRQDVLTAILAQNELNRKQIVIVLHEQNKAFQRPVDFDGLKEIRRTLKAELVIVARSGSGPAEFARQRRFTVYSSLESFASSLRAETPPQESRKGWFGSRRHKEGPTTDALDKRQPLPVMPVPVPAPAVTDPPAAAAQAQDSRRGKHDKDDEDDIPTLISPNNGAILAGGAAAIGAAGAALLGHDDDLLAPPPSPPSPPSSPSPVKPVSNGHQDSVSKPASPRSTEPKIIQLGKSTKKLPAVEPEAAVAASTASPAILAAPAVAPKPVKNSSSGKQRAVLAGGAGTVGTVGAAGAGMAAFAAAQPPTTTSGAPPGGGTPTGQGGRGGGGGPRRGSRRLLAVLLVLLTVLLLAGIVLASPPGQQMISHVLPGTTTATVTITPNYQDIANDFVITAVTGTPNPAARQVQASIISATTASASATAHATGSIPGQRASGTLTFINTGSQGVTIAGGILTGKDGVQVAFNGLFVPGGATTTTGTAVNPGTSGNIPALDIFQSCCAPNILVRNFSPFSGGVNPQPNSVITQNDINSATNSLIAKVKPQAQSQLQGKVKANQAVVPNSLSCTSNVSANHKVGDVTPTVTVTGTATCSEEVYDHTGALNLAAQALTTQANSKLGPGYAPADNKILTTVTQVTVINASKTVSVVVHAEGIWVFQITPALENQLKNAIANKSKSDATAYLLATPGIKAVQITISNNGNTLPAANNITIIVKVIHAPTGTPTPVSPTPTTGVTPPPSPTPQTGQGGS
jgi:hypothetical protein